MTPSEYVGDDGFLDSQTLASESRRGSRDSSNMPDQPSDRRRYHRQHHHHHRQDHGCPGGSSPAAGDRTDRAGEDMGPGQRERGLATGRSSPSEVQAGSSLPAAVAAAAGTAAAAVAGRDRECLGKEHRRTLAEAGLGRLRREEGTRS